MRPADLSAEAARALAILEDGGRIEARRVYPRPHQFWLYRPNGVAFAQPLAAATIDSLVTQHLVVASVAGDPGDVVNYDTITYQLASPAHAAH